MRAGEEAGAPVLLAEEPMRRIAFRKLLGGMQLELGPRQRRVDPDQVDRILQLVPESKGAG